MVFLSMRIGIAVAPKWYRVWHANKKHPKPFHLYLH